MSGRWPPPGGHARPRNQLEALKSFDVCLKAAAELGQESLSPATTRVIVRSMSLTSRDASSRGDGQARVNGTLRRKSSATCSKVSHSTPSCPLM